MKKSEQTWEDYLRDGVELMEGATPDGRRRPREAEAIFWECIHSKPLDTNIPNSFEIEARCRLAQLRSYQGCGEAALETARVARELMDNNMDDKSRAQCLLILSTIEAKHGSQGQGRIDLNEASRLAQPEDHKLWADIHNIMAKQSFDLIRQYSLSDQQLAQAIFFIEEAIKDIRRTPLTPLCAHAEAAIYARAGMFYAQAGNKDQAQIYIGMAQQMFACGEVKDSGVRAGLWKAKMHLADLQDKQIQATWYFLRQLVSAARCRWQLTTYM